MSHPLPALQAIAVSQVYGPPSQGLNRAMAWLGRRRRSGIRALDRVDLRIERGQVLGLVGESGCGKSTLARILAGIRRPTSGEVHIDGVEIGSLTGAKAVTAKLRTQMIFQDPYASLNPRMRVAEIIAEAPRLHGLIRGSESAFVDQALERTGLDPSFKHRFPHQFSGGQRQRVVIARALAVSPEVLVCDEPVSALDVSIQAQVLNLFQDLREQLGLSYLFISHDLGVVQHVSDRVAIMYLGRIVEEAPTQEIFHRPNHPYTQALLAETPRIALEPRQFTPIVGEMPSPANPPPGCHFHPRCPHAMAICRTSPPALQAVAPGHASACHLNDLTRSPNLESPT